MISDEIGAGVESFGEIMPMVKAHFIGREDIPESNAKQAKDEETGLFTEAGAITPPFDPELLCNLFDHSSNLRPNIDAYATNIDSFGHRFEPVIDFGDDDVDEKIAVAMFLEHGSKGDFPDESAVEARKKELKREMLIEKSKLENLFDFCCVDQSFVELRRKTRQDREVIGNGYWEVLRDAAGDIAQFEYVPSLTMRLLPFKKGEPFIPVKQRVKVSDLKYEEFEIKRRFRRYIQIMDHHLSITGGHQAIYFKELGDPRVISRRTGEVVARKEDLEEGDAPATEILHFKIHNPRSAYGIPRWIGALLSVMGTRQAEEVNFLYFENKSVPPLAILVSGGRLSAESIPRLENYVENNIRGKHNFHKILILEAEPPGESKNVEHTGRLKIELKPLTGAQQSDALFMKYDERNADKVGQNFRLPRMLRGDVRDFNKGTAVAALMFAELQVFNPERQEFDFTMDRRILADLGIRFWKFVSNAPVNRDPATMAEIIRNLSNAGAISFNKAQDLLEEVFNKTFPKSKAPWANRPLSLTLQQVPFDEELSKQDLGTADLAAAGARLPSQGNNGPRRSFESPIPIDEEARRLLRIRGALQKAEAEAAGEELTEEVIRVPRAEFESWFEKASTGG